MQRRGHSARTAARHFLSNLMFDSFDLHGRARRGCAGACVRACAHRHLFHVAVLFWGELALQNLPMTRGKTYQRVALARIRPGGGVWGGYRGGIQTQHRPAPV